MKDIAQVIHDLSNLVIPVNQQTHEFRTLINRTKELLAHEGGGTNSMYMVLEGLHRIGTHLCDDILRDVFVEGRMSQFKRNVGAELLFFSSLLDRSGPKLNTDIAIIKRIL